MHKLFLFYSGLESLSRDHEEAIRNDPAYYKKHTILTFHEAGDNEIAWWFIVRVLEICQTHVESLEFTGCRTPYSFYLPKPLTFSNLTRVHFDRGSVSYRFFWGLMSSTPINIQLGFHMCVFTEERPVDRRTNVKELDIGNLSPETLETLFETIGAAVETIFVVTAECISRHGFKWMGAFLVYFTDESFNRKCPMLKSLIIRDAVFTPCVSLHAILLQCPQLERLDLKADSMLFLETQSGIKKMLWTHPRLREIDLFMMVENRQFRWSSERSEAYKAAMCIIALATPRRISRLKNGNNLRKFPPEMLMCVYDCLV